MPRQPEVSFSSRLAGGLTLRPTVFWASRERHRVLLPHPAHVHAHYELICCQQGVYVGLVGDHEVRLAAGEALLVQPGDRHHDPLSGSVEYLACGFRLEPAVATSAALLASTASRRLPAGGTAFAAFIVALTHAATTTPSTWDWSTLDARCALWLCEWLPTLESTLLNAAFRLRGDDPALAARLHAVLAQHPERPLSLATLANRADLPLRAFAAACRTHLGLSPLAARRRARCEAAARLLMQGQTVAKTAAALGFANPFHFSRAFRRAFGVPPSAWRR